MNKMLVTFVASLFAANLAMAQSAAPAAAKSASCSDQAAEKKLAGAAKNSFMKKCEKESGAAKSDGKSAAKSAQQEKMKSCNKEAKDKNLKGDERKKFMSGCLKKS
jgi:hypothetical protein